MATSAKTRALCMSLMLILFFLIIGFKTANARTLKGVIKVDYEHSLDFNLKFEEKLNDKLAPLLLNFLPRGTIPPSGPSKGTNDITT